MRFRWYLAPILLAVGLLFQTGCGSAPEALPEADTGEVDDLMDETEVPEPE